MSEEKQPTLAEELSAARQARGLDLEEAQQQTGISLSVLQGIEEGQLDVVEPVFVRLALKSYAEFLGLDPEPLLTRFDQQQSLASQPRQRPTVLISQPVPPRSHKPLIITGIAIGVCCALAAAFYFFGDRIVPSRTPTQSADPPPATTTPTPATVTPAQSQPITAPNDPLVAQSSTEPDAAADTSATAVAAQTTGSAAVVLELEARASTWVQVRWDDAAEDFEGVVPSGERHRFEARNHFVVLSTNPHGLRYWLDGQLLGGGQLGDPNQVLRFRATADGIELLGRDSQALTEETSDAQP